PPGRPRPHELQAAVVLIAVEVEPGERGVRRELRALAAHGDVDAAARVGPDLVARGPPAGGEETPPLDPAFARPALVAVAPLVERPPQLHGRLHLEGVILLEALVAAGVALRKEQVEDDVGGADLELVVARLVRGG